MYTVKVPRYDKWSNNGDMVLAFLNELNQVSDNAILKYVPALRKNMHLSKKGKVKMAYFAQVRD